MQREEANFSNAPKKWSIQKKAVRALSSKTGPLPKGPLSREMAGVAGLEPVTSAVTGQRSNQLSYTPAKGEAKRKRTSTVNGQR